jgi:hypothetical protein
MALGGHMKFTRFAIFNTILVFIFSPLLFSQENMPFMFYKGDEKDSNTVLIDTGYVVINGVLFRPPFVMELKNDTIWVNQVAAFPALPYTKGPVQSHPLYPPLVKLDSSQKKLAADIKSKYKEYNEEFGEDKAKEMIISEYKSNPLLSSITLYEDEGIISYTLIFQNGTEIGVTVKYDTKIKQQMSLTGIRAIPPDSIKAQNKRWVELQFHGFQKLLSKGSMLLLTRGAVGGADARGVIETVEKLKREKISQQDAMEELGRYRCLPDEAIMIMENIDSW